MTTARLAAAMLLSASCATAATQAQAHGDHDNRVIHTRYDGITNDLLTAGLGKTGLGSAAPPGFADPLHPTAEELRRLAIYNNYRALDRSDARAAATARCTARTSTARRHRDRPSEGQIAGDEYIAFDDDGDGRRNVTMMVQVPDTFDPTHGCIVTAPSSGSRGVYGAIATAGEWGLKRGCAVAYTDKGTGTGAHDLQNNTVNLIRGERADAAAGAATTRTSPRGSSAASAPPSTPPRPNRFAFKHAHSQQNPEKDWGRNVLRSIEFAFVRAQREDSRARGTSEITKRNTIVIASSVSNGGGASVRAVEQDDERPDRRRSRWRAQREPEAQPALLHRAARAAAGVGAQPPADRLHHAGQRVPGMRRPRAGERGRAAQPRRGARGALRRAAAPRAC